MTLYPFNLPEPICGTCIHYWAYHNKDAGRCTHPQSRYHGKTMEENDVCDMYEPLNYRYKDGTEPTK